MDEREFIAAERALGFEPKTGETRAEAALRAVWEQRLAPLLRAAPEVEPPASLLSRIEAEIESDVFGITARGEAGFAEVSGVSIGSVSGRGVDAGAADERTRGGSVVSLAPLRRQVRVWKGVAGVAVAAAAALALYIAVPFGASPSEGRYVAVVTADDGSGAGLVVEFDTASGVATVVPLTSPPDGNSYQMWTIPEGETKPVSLGLLPTAAEARAGLSPTPGQLFAISLEPEGGSPTGQPTQALFHGTLERVE